MNKSAVGSRCFKWQLIDFNGTKLGWSVFAVRLMFLVKRVNGFGSHRSIFSFIQTACASRMPKRENPLDGCPSSMRYRDSILRESNIFNQNVSPWNQIQTTLRTSTRTWKGRSKRLFFSKLDPACIRESRSHPREREREIPCIYTRNIARYFSLLWTDIGEGKREVVAEIWKSWKRREKRGIRRSGRQANRYASESIFARYTTVLHSECIPRHTGVHQHTHASYSLSATLMWHGGGSGCHVSLATLVHPENGSFSSRNLDFVLDHPRSVNISLFAPFVSAATIAASSTFFPRLVFRQFSLAHSLTGNLNQDLIRFTRFDSRFLAFFFASHEFFSFFFSFFRVQSW